MKFPECSKLTLSRTKMLWLPLAALLSLQLMAMSAYAQEDTRCPADIYGSSLQCVASDVSVATIEFDANDLPETCVAGEIIELPIELGFVINANANRDDIAVWIAQTPGDIQQPSTGTGPQSCDVLTLPGQIISEPAPPSAVGNQLVVDDTDGDVCYDVLGGSADEFFLSDFAPDTVKVLCQPDSNGQLAFQTLVSWDSVNSGNACDGTPEGFTGRLGNSKCEAGDPIVLPIDVQVSLTIEKQTLPDGSSQSFNYSGTVGGSAFTGFSLTDGNSNQILGLLDDQFLVTEAATPGWYIDSIECTNNQTGLAATATVNTETGLIDITLGGSQFDVTCVYNNVEYPTLTVVKNTEGGDDTFGFAWGSTSNSQSTFDLTTEGNTKSSDPITVTTGIGDTDFYVTETLPAEGWEFVSASCTGASNNGTPGAGTVTGITLNAGDDAICTFNNREFGTIRIDKTTVGGDATFAYTSTSGIGSLGNAFTIMTTAESGTTGDITGLSAGTYDVTETDPQSNPGGWDFTNLECVDPSGGTVTDGRTATIDLAAGETVTCTYTNTKRGSITVVKTTQGGDGTFSFTGTGPNNFDFGGGFDVTTSGNTSNPDNNVVFDNLELGAYSLTETAQDGWDLDSASCNDDDGSDPTSIQLDAGEEIICTFDNIERGSITVVKVITSTQPENKTFSFTGTGPDDFDFGGGFTLTPTDIGLGGADSTSPDYANLVPGAYTVTEADPTADGWRLVGVLCSGEDYADPVTNPATITLDPGEEVTCTFTNAPLGTTTIVKNSIGGEGSFGFTWGTQGNDNIPPNESATFDLNTADGNPPTSGTASQGFILGPETDYDLTESSLPGTVDPYARAWSLTNLDCGDAGELVQIPGANGSDVTITGSAEENVTCTFTNTLEGALVVRKETLPDGFDQAFSFTGDADLTGSIRDYSSFSEELVLTAQPGTGTFGTTEDVPDGWVLSNISCTGATNSTVSIGTGGDFSSPEWNEGDDQIEVDLAAGEVVICTFENTKLGQITIEKIVEGGDDSFDFQTSYDPGSFSLMNGESDTSGYLAWDTYTITETVTAGYELTDITCSGDVNSNVTTGDTGVQIDLEDGEEIACTFTNTATARIATFQVYKKFMDGNNITPVTLKIQCNSGQPNQSEVTLIPQEINDRGDYTVNFVIDKFTDGMDCMVWEEPIPGYTPSYVCGVFADEGVITQCSDGDDSPLDDFGEGPCYFTDVATTGISPIRHYCTIRNYPDPVTASVTKEWYFPNTGGQYIPQVTDITIWCDSEIVGGTFDNPYWYETFEDVEGTKTVTSDVVPDFPMSYCWADESITDSSIEKESDCGDVADPGMVVSVGNPDSCKMTNTVFFEGIPTLNQWGVALMALLMLGVGLVGFRRFA